MNRFVYNRSVIYRSVDLFCREGFRDATQTLTNKNDKLRNFSILQTKLVF